MGLTRARITSGRKKGMHSDNEEEEAGEDQIHGQWRLAVVVQHLQKNKCILNFPLRSLLSPSD